MCIGCLNWDTNFLPLLQFWYSCCYHQNQPPWVPQPPFLTTEQRRNATEKFYSHLESRELHTSLRDIYTNYWGGKLVNYVLFSTDHRLCPATYCWLLWSREERHRPQIFWKYSRSVLCLWRVVTYEPPWIALGLLWTPSQLAVWWPSQLVFPGACGTSAHQAGQCISSIGSTATVMEQDTKTLLCNKQYHFCDLCLTLIFLTFNPLRFASFYFYRLVCLEVGTLQSSANSMGYLSQYSTSFLCVILHLCKIG